MRPQWPIVCVVLCEIRSVWEAPMLIAEDLKRLSKICKSRRTATSSMIDTLNFICDICIATANLTKRRHRWDSSSDNESLHDIWLILCIKSLETVNCADFHTLQVLKHITCQLNCQYTATVQCCLTVLLANVEYACFYWEYAFYCCLYHTQQERIFLASTWSDVAWNRSCICWSRVWTWNHVTFTIYHNIVYVSSLMAKYYWRLQQRNVKSNL